MHSSPGSKGPRDSPVAGLMTLAKVQGTGIPIVSMSFTGNGGTIATGEVSVIP